MDFEQYLSSKEDTAVSPESLRQLGGKAAALYIRDSKPLNDTIAEMAKESSLNIEQVRRVSEYANNATFAHLFKNEYDKNITFPMADAAAIMQNKDQTKEKVASRKVLPKGSYIPGQEYVNLEDAFKAEDVEKLAGVSETERGVLAKQFLDLKIERDNLSSEVDLLADSFAVKLSSLKDLCKEALAEGYSSSTIGSAIEAGNPSIGLREVIEIDFGDRLAEFGYNEKLAMHGMALMPGNPISGLTQDLEGVSGKLVSAQQAMHRVQMAMTELLTILRGPDPGHTMANQVFNPGGMGSHPAPPPQGQPPAGPPPAGGPPAAAPSAPSPLAAGGPPASPVSGGAPGGKNLGALFGGK